MNNDIKVGIGVDATKAEQGFKRVKKELDDLKKKTKEGFFDLEGEKRVERNLGAMVQGLAKATSGAEALAIGLDRIENVFKSSIGASVAVAGIATLIGKYLEAQAVIKATGEEIEKVRDFVAREGQANPNADIEGQISGLKKQAEALSGFWNRLFTDNGERKQARAEINAIVESLEDMKKKRAELAEMAAKGEEIKALEEYQKKVKEYNESLLEWQAKQDKARDDIRKKREEQEKKDREDVEKAKASFALEEWKKYWQGITDLADKARKEIDKKDREAAEAKKKRDEESAQQRIKLEGEVAAARESLESKTAERNKEYREKIIADELKTPGQRNQERQDAREAERAEDRAIKRLAQKAQDKQNSSWRNQRMTNEDRDALANKLRQQRAEDKKPQMEKDISEINQAIKKLEQKIGVQ